MRRDKLAAIADLMESMDDGTEPRVYKGRNVGFDMSAWLARRPPMGILTNEPCGYAACAIGHAVLAGILDDELVFIGKTFGVGPDKEIGPLPLEWLDANEAKPHAGFMVRHIDRDRWGETDFRPIDSVAIALGLDREVARFLFLPTQYRGAHESCATPASVAKRIRYILDGGDIEWWDAILDEPVMGRG